MAIDGNFLDTDEAESVSSNMYDWTFEQAITVAEPLGADECVLINWTMPKPAYTSAIIRNIAKQCDCSFSLVAQTALIHGFSIFTHKYSSAVGMISALDDVAIVGDIDDYFEHLAYNINLGKDIKRLPVRTDPTTAEVMGNTAAILRTSRTTLAGTCVLLSIITSEDAIPASARKTIAAPLKRFDIGMKMYQSIATQLI